MLHPCLARGVTAPRPQPWLGRPASTPARPAPKDAAEGAEERITSPHVRRRPEAAREVSERRGTLGAMRRSLRSGPAHRLKAQARAAVALRVACFSLWSSCTLPARPFRPRGLARHSPQRRVSPSTEKAVRRLPCRSLAHPRHPISMPLAASSVAERADPARVYVTASRRMVFSHHRRLFGRSRPIGGEVLAAALATATVSSWRMPNSPGT